MAATERPILFHYPGSPYAHRVLWYLWLRGIAYDECLQPPYMPRPDLASINVNYRRIPVMAIGKDVYCDSRLIIQKLEEYFPESKLEPTSATDKGIRRLLESWTVDGGIFSNSVKLMPYWSSPALKDPKFVEDRRQLSGGRRMTAEEMGKGRPEGLVHMRQAFEMLETTFLADGRKWILGTDGPTTADVDAVWPFEWLAMEPSMKGSLPDEFIGEKRFPKTFAYIKRLMDEAKARKLEGPKPTRLDGEKMRERVLGAASQLQPTTFIPDDPLQLQQGEEVEVYPSDYGLSHKDRGALVGLAMGEVVIRNEKGLHIHFPRWNYRVERFKPERL